MQGTRDRDFGSPRVPGERFAVEDKPPAPEGCNEQPLLLGGGSANEEASSLDVQPPGVRREACLSLKPLAP